jgi:hypothetical protein
MFHSSPPPVIFVRSWSTNCHENHTVNRGVGVGMHEHEVSHVSSVEYRHDSRT